MGAIAALVLLLLFVVVMRVGTIAIVQPNPNIGRSATSGTEEDSHDTDRLAA
jgi:hypothetical protein